MNTQPVKNAGTQTLVKVKSLKRLIINKTYEMHKNVISESYFDVTDTQEAINFVIDFVHNLNNGLILVINSTLNIDEVTCFLKGIQNYCKLIISYNSSLYTPDNKYFEKIKTIRTSSINSAASTAYGHLENKQAILFAYVDTNFDLFEYLD